MLIDSAHLSYCTNIHASNCWEDDFSALKKYFPLVKRSVSPKAPMGIGLRLSNNSCNALLKPEAMNEFKDWLNQVDGYVYTMNGFPYGNFHNTVVKDNVHSPDWTTADRTVYTINLFKILSMLLPEGLEGSISTSPLSYRHWFKDASALNEAKKSCTDNIITVLIELIQLSATTGKTLHLDLEPEPDGVIETGEEFINWFQEDLIPLAIPALTDKFSVARDEALALVRKHICLCYDVCHFAIGYEDHEQVIKELEAKGIKIGKIQISAALKADIPMAIDDRNKVFNAFADFNESTYLHQVVAKTNDDKLLRYADLPDALQDQTNPDVKEWRAHFHIPVSADYRGIIQSTQDDIITVLKINKEKRLTKHLEIETYTWEVLPESLKLPLEDSISNELHWVIDQLQNNPGKV